MWPRTWPRRPWWPQRNRIPLLNSLLYLGVLASPAGFEPTAPGLGILCSILLSYGDFDNSFKWL